MRLITFILLLIIGVVSFSLGRYFSTAEDLTTQLGSSTLSKIKTKADKRETTLKQSIEANTKYDKSKNAESKLLSDEELAQFLKLNINPTGQELMNSFNILREMSFVDLKAVFIQVLDTPIARAFDKSEILVFIAGKMNEVDRKATLSFISGRTDIEQETQLRIIGSSMIFWSYQSPKQAKDWLLSNKALRDFEQEVATMLVIEQLALKDYPTAIQLLEHIDPQYYENAIVGFAMASKESKQFLFLRTLVEPNDENTLDLINIWWMRTKPAEMALWLSEHYDLEDKLALKNKLYRAYASLDLVDATTWYEANTLESDNSELNMYLEYFVPSSDYQKVFDWLESRPAHYKHYESLFHNALESNPEFAYQMLSSSNRWLDSRKGRKGRNSRNNYLQVYTALLDEGSDVAEDLLKYNPYTDDEDFVESLKQIKAY